MSPKQLSLQDHWHSGPVFRFFKLLMPLGAVDGFKKLNAIAFLSERGRDFARFSLSYERSWHRECLCPQSEELARDVRILGSMNWLLAVPQIELGEPIHYRYILSPAGLLESSRTGALDLLVNKMKEATELADYVSQIMALNVAPVSWSLALSSSYDSEYPPRFSSDIEREDEVNHVDGELLKQLVSFYSQMFGEANVRLSGRQLRIVLDDPKAAVHRYEYLRRSLWEHEPSDESIAHQLSTMPVIFRERMGIEPSELAGSIRTKISELRQSLERGRGLIEKRFDLIFRDAEQYYADIVKCGGEIHIIFAETGKVKLDFSEEIRKGPVARQGTSLIWNLLQPIEAARLIGYDGLQWLVERLLTH